MNYLNMHYYFSKISFYFLDFLKTRKKSFGADGEIASTMTDSGGAGRRGWGRLTGDASDARLLATAADMWD
jgi:hypothetical protein